MIIFLSLNQEGLDFCQIILDFVASEALVLFSDLGNSKAKMSLEKLLCLSS